MNFVRRAALVLALAAGAASGMLVVPFGAQTAEAAVASSIVVKGNVRVETATIRNYVTIKPGKSYSADDIDASVKALKGENRPINAEKDRAEVLSALRCVDYVSIFPQVRATELIRALRPQVYAKGGDYTPESLHPEERDALREIGAEIRILPLVAGKSTTGTLARIHAS